MTYAKVINGKLKEATEIKPLSMDGWDEVDIPIINIRYIDGEYKSVELVPSIEHEQPKPTPEIRMAQCRAQLIIDGKDDDVEALLASIADPIQQKLYRAYFEYEPIVKRDNVMINEMAPLLGIDLDQFFIDASKL